LDDGLREILGVLCAADGPAGAGVRDLSPAARIIADLAGGPCAIYALDPPGGALTLRSPGAVAEDVGPPAVIPMADITRIRPRLDAGEIVGGPGDRDGGAHLRSVGFGDGVLIPARWSGRCVGAIHVRGATRDERVDAWLRAVGDALGPALGAERLSLAVGERTDALDRRLRQLDALSEVSRRVALAVDEGDVAATVVREARRLVDADLAILFGRENGSDLRPVASDGWSVGDPEPAVVALTRAHGADPVWLGRELGVGVGPSDDEGMAPDLLVVARRGATPFGDDDIGRLSGLARQAAIALDNARLVGRLRRERAERRALAAALVDAQEEERRRVAEDIHDGPVQELVGVSLLLDALSADLHGSAPQLGAEADRAAALARDTLRGLRRAIFDLHPVALQDLGFAAATRTLVQRLEWQGVDVSVEVGAADLLPPALRTVAFRTCQEAIANVLRHAEPRAVRIGAHRAGGRVVLEVTDDGRGFDPAQPGNGIGEGHLGLTALRERAGLVGGDLQVISGAGQGTRIILRLPLDDGGG
jgi:signal transduction histidine kinase